MSVTIAHLQFLETGEQQLYHTLMLAQDNDDIFISVGSYSDAYLSYLFASNPARILPPVTEDIPMLEIRELGPFDISERSDLRQLAQIILSLVIRQLEGYPAGELIRRRLGRW